ncbi:carbohydrate porin [Bradyrhizobium sp. CCBAU 45384]|uniref:carbohydrate porin n=1 Tax=Bradyrhizobium sp. CCBAU 45384 TaxID=858428 RepID=UPI002305B1D0|nr:carbohydrate porin [Bradyrhizobium sp. CCBAU 45384]
MNGSFSELIAMHVDGDKRDKTPRWLPILISNKGRNVVAISLAASLISNVAMAGNAETTSGKSHAPDTALKSKLTKKNSHAAKPEERPRPGAEGLRGASALAQGAIAPKLARHDIVAQPAQDEASKFARFDKLRERGLEINIPAPIDTVDQDKTGLRSALADVGVGYVAWTVNSYVQNVLPNAARSTIANQLYNGQNPTFNTVNYVMVTYDLTRYGIPDGQIIAGMEQQSWTWQPGGPDRLGINTLAYYQTFFDRALELKFGYLRNSHEFAGTLVGGNAGASIFGPSSNVLYQGGMSSNATPTPAVNLRYNFDRNFYSKLSVQRSISPDGVATEVNQNPEGLYWRTPNTGVLALDETGYQTKAAPGVFDTWLRAGIGYNTSHYTNIPFPKNPRGDENTFYYVAADRQFSQIAPQGAASRGIYGGFSVMGAPPDQNKVTQYYEVRLYAKGLFDSRPTDQISIVATDTVWSNFAVQNALAAKNLAHNDSKAISGTYTAHLGPGVYLNLGLTYINNPTTITYTPQTGHALNFSASTSIFF